MRGCKTAVSTAKAIACVLLTRATVERIACMAAEPSAFIPATSLGETSIGSGGRRFWPAAFDVAAAATPCLLLSDMLKRLLAGDAPKYRGDRCVAKPRVAVCSRAVGRRDANRHQETLSSPR